MHTLNFTLISIPSIKAISKKILVCAILFLCATAARAQGNAIAWQVTLGGPGNDILQDIYPTADGNYILIGIDSLQGGDVEYPVHGWHDIWIIKMDKAGNIIWQKSYGGSKEEGNPNVKIIQTSDGGYLFVTEAWSSDFDVVGHHDLSDAWTVKLDSLGNIQWSHSFGGMNFDVPRNVLELPGQRYLIMSRSTSTDGDVPVVPGKTGFNAWVFILNKDGEIIHNYLFGGSGYDDLYTPILMADGTIAMFGMTSSSDGDLTGLNPDTLNAWYIRIDTSGNILENHIYPTAKSESFLDAVRTSDGGFLAGGEMMSKPDSFINVGSYHGNTDYWAVRLDSTGKIVWQGIYGGSGVDGFKRVVAISNQNGLESGYYLAGASSSNDGDVNGDPNDGQDMWVITINSEGILNTSSKLGGSSKDFGDAITSSGIAVGGAYSNDGDLSGVGVDGDGDGWVVQLATATNANIPPSTIHNEIGIYPNPTSNGVATIELPVQSFNSAYKLEMINVTGKILKEENVHASKIILHTNEPAGTYWLRLLKSDQVIAVGKLTVQ